MAKISMVMPYFGKWPKWFNLYLETCRYNSTIDWTFFTNCEEPENRMGNVSYIKMSLAEFNFLASTKLGFKVSITNPIKICDIRPAFGVIFEDYLKGSDFWGHGDIDLIYGDIGKFIRRADTDGFEIISPGSNSIVGNFTLYKNISKINLLYEQIPGYRKLCQWVWPLQVDEYNMANLLNKMILRKEIKSILRGAVQHDILRPRTLSKNWSVFWHKGRLSDAKTQEELMYFHFMLSKDTGSFAFPEYKMNMESFTLSGERLTPRMHTFKGKLRRFFNHKIRSILSKQ